MIEEKIEMAPSEKHIRLDTAIHNLDDTADRLGSLLSRICDLDNEVTKDVKVKTPNISLLYTLNSSPDRIYAICDKLEKTIEELRIALLDG